MAGNERGDAARRYHEATKHSPAGLRSSPHFLDWNNQPRPFKIYDEIARLPLPAVGASSGPSLFRSLDRFREAGAAGADDRELDLSALSRVLHHAAGITKRIRTPAGEMAFRAAPCTGALYHVDLYVVSGELRDLAAGVYHYDPRDETLGALRGGDFRASLVDASGGGPELAGAAAVLVCATTFWRNAWKYRARAYRHAFWDGGTLLSQCLAMCSALGVPAHTVLGFADGDVNELLGLDGRREAALALVALGGGAPASAERPESEPIDPRTLPLSPSPIDYPAIEEMHRASALESPDEAREWRRRARAFADAAEARPPARAAGAASPIEASGRAGEVESDEPLEAVIRRRGSARRFARESIRLSELSTILAAAESAAFSVEGLPREGTAAQLYLIVNDVDDLASGSYVYDGREGTLVLLAEGDFRARARHLDLDQDLAGDAAVDVYVLAELEVALEALGNRGYRLCQLEGGLIGGRVYLAAYALGLAATGLTFYDDAVTDFFSPHAAGKAVMFLVAVGRRAPRRVLYQR